MQFVKEFLGPSGWCVTVYKLYAVYTDMGFMYDLLYCVWPQVRIAANETKESKILLCWHRTFNVLKTVSQRYKAFHSSDW